MKGIARLSYYVRIEGYMAVKGASRIQSLKGVRRAYILGTLVLGLALVAGALWVFLYKEISLQAIEDTIQSWGPWGVVLSLGLMVLHSFVPFPAELIAFSNGMVYGPVWGTVITWTGAMLGAFLAFGLARALGRPFVEALLSEKKWQMVDDWAAKEAGSMVFLSRFVPVISFNLINYAAGITRIPWWTFAWTTGLGILPLITLMVVMGDNIEALSWKAWLLLFGVGIALWILLRKRFLLRNEGT